MRMAVATAALFTMTTVLSGTARTGETPPAAADTVDAFHAALAAGEKETALHQLAPSVVVFEGGHAENSRDEYEAHHLGADMAFSRAVERTVVDRTVRKPSEAVHIVLSTTRTTGTFREKSIDLTGRETMVLVRDDDTWRITHIHWSSSRAH